MPLIFPSHQGLVLPLWRLFPRRIDAVALCVGAAMPDVVDGIAGAFRGGLGQWIGHSLLGAVLCIPPGLLLARLVRRACPRRATARLDEVASPARDGRLIRDCLSLGLGALSHVAFDLVTHGSFLLLFPWYRNDRLFPSWWYTVWGTIPLPGYREPYPLAPHTVAWLVLTVVGAVLFVRCLRRRGQR